MPKRKWVYNTCYQEALKYVSISGFKKGNESAYNVARKNGWFDYYTWFISTKELRSKSRPYRVIWTRKHCYQVATKYTTRNELCEGNFNAYQVACKHKWLDDYTWFATSCKPKGFWTYETCYQEAIKYTSRNEFQKGSGGAYDSACRHKWIDDYIWLTTSCKPNGFWTYETCYQEAIKYTSRNDFKKGCSRAYTVACRHKWLDNYIWFENEKVNYINSKIDCVYVYIFKETNAVYVGRTIHKTERDYQHIFGNDTVSNYAKGNDYILPKMIIIDDNLTVKEGVEKEGYWVNYYKDNGYIILNKVKTGSIGSIGYGKWNKKSCFNEAMKYTSRNEFQKGSRGAYVSACKHKWLDDYTWFNALRKPKGFWKYETCYQEAIKYTSIREFYKGSVSAYNVALENNWLNYYTWLIRLNKPNGFWKYETCYQEATKYTSRNEFKKGNASAYGSASRHKWLDNYTWFENVNVNSINVVSL